MKRNIVIGVLGCIIILGAGWWFVGEKTMYTGHIPKENMNSDHMNMDMGADSMNTMAMHNAHQHAHPDEAKLIRNLQKGGYILYARHERTELGKTFDAEPIQFENCATQRNLSEAGKASAQEIGEAIKILDIPISKSFTSPFCRSVDTAVGMFGSAEKVISLSGRASVDEALDLTKAGEYTNTFLQSLTVPTNSNVAITGHWGALMAATGVHLHEGDIAVFLKDGVNIVYKGTIHPATWSDVIHDNERMMMHSNMMGEMMME